MLLRPKLAHHGAEDTGPDRLLVLVDQHCGIRIEADHRAVGAADVLGGADDHRSVNVALFDAATRRRFLDGNDDDVADTSGTALGAAQHLDALDALGPAVVSDVQVGLHLDHRSIPSSLLVPRRRPGSRLFLSTPGPRPSPGYQSGVRFGDVFGLGLLRRLPGGLL